MNIATGNFYESNEKMEMNYGNEKMKRTNVVLRVLSLPEATHCPEEKTEFELK